MLTQFVIGTIAAALILGIGGPLMLPSLLDRARLARTFSEQVDAARSLATNNSGAGATLYIDSSSGTNTTFVLYRGRPEPGNGLSPGQTTGPMNGVVRYGGANQFAVFVSSSGTAAALPWTPTSGNVNVAPCYGQFNVTVTTSTGTTTVAPSC